MIIWHKWPEEKPRDPDEFDRFLVWKHDGYEAFEAQFVNENGGTWIFENQEDYKEYDITDDVLWWTMINMPEGKQWSN